MKPLIEGVYGQLKTDVGIIAHVGTHVYTGRAPEHADMPYLVVQMLASWPVDRNTSTEQIEIVPMRVQVWSIDSEVVVEAIEAVEKSLRVTLPTLSTGTVMEIIKSSNALEIDPDPTTKGEDVWMGIIDLDCRIQRDPTI